jgi:putative DNA primase/helicase
MRHEGVKSLARGQWRGVLLNFGVPESALQAKHGPCPFCGGKDRYRWDNKCGDGTYFCSRCGPGSGIDLLMKFKGWDYRTAAREVEALLIVRPVRSDAVTLGLSAAEMQTRVLSLLSSCRPIASGDRIDRYFRARGVAFPDYPDDLLACDRCRVEPGLWLPALVAKVVDVDGKTVSLHRTWLGEGRKADIDTPRKLMPGPLPAGACVRLSAPRSVLCLAEGIETALSVEKLMCTPCWATLSAPMMRKWEPPTEIEEVTICADNDINGVGQGAAQALAGRLRARGIEVNVRVPPSPGTDWNDVLLKETT